MQSETPQPAADPDRPRTLAQRLLTRLLHVYFRFARGVTFGVRGVVLNDRGEVFLIRHTYVPGWHFPGGGVEVGETAELSLERELSEEAGIAPTERPVLHGLFFNRRISRRDHVAVYVLRRFRVERVKKPDREIAEAGFFPLDRLPNGTTPATRRRLAEIISGQPPAIEW
ncbi:NUDIX domain-containing protein [Bosea robiniae]|uniref:ADP-ribose pyrophosphatase YjhB, NUDIX family n=1 Tax=Bosea robiniae TaxID=1036780 RepID=A0ABY0NN42_9HYPH|nr:NUDIX domain-containing protein [Bosea robiniae]SDF80603.1 ADP-ribose pyrophosphatase YjhB, NUDIX family [Bosea robiniae]